MTLLEAVLRGVKDFALGFGTCPYRLFGMASRDREAIIVRDLPSVNHPDVADTYAPAFVQIAVYHRLQDTAQTRARLLFEALDAYKRSAGGNIRWELPDWTVYDVGVQPPLDLGDVTINGVVLQEVVMTVQLVAQRQG